MGKIISEDIHSALILEDDVYFENKFSKTLNSLWNEITFSSIEFDIIFLSYKRVEHNPDIKKYQKIYRSQKEEFGGFRDIFYQIKEQKNY